MIARSNLPDEAVFRPSQHQWQNGATVQPTTPPVAAKEQTTHHAADSELPQTLLAILFPSSEHKKYTAFFAGFVNDEAEASQRRRKRTVAACSKTYWGAAGCTRHPLPGTML